MVSPSTTVYNRPLQDEGEVMTGMHNTVPAARLLCEAIAGFAATNAEVVTPNCEAMAYTVVMPGIVYKKPFGQEGVTGVMGMMGTGGAGGAGGITGWLVLGMHKTVPICKLNGFIPGLAASMAETDTPNRCPNR